MELKTNQSALILESDEDGEVTVNVESPDINGLTGTLCQAIATKLMNDEQFQEELTDMLGDVEKKEL
jgi:hypothetical protein